MMETACDFLRKFFPLKGSTMFSKPNPEHIKETAHGLVDSAAQATTRAIDKTVDGSVRLGEKASQAYESASDKTRSALDSMADRGSDYLHQSAAKAQEYRDLARDKAVQYRDQAQAYVQEKPLQAVAIAAGIGAVVASLVLLAAGGRRRD
jgi:ElaB/YqjD/DUF883 family membrane-anchored ribosome-binding protein